MLIYTYTCICESAPQKFYDGICWFPFDFLTDTAASRNNPFHAGRIIFIERIDYVQVHQFAQGKKYTNFILFMIQAETTFEMKFPAHDDDDIP